MIRRLFSISDIRLYFTIVGIGCASQLSAQYVEKIPDAQVPLTPNMVISEEMPTNLIDEQSIGENPMLSVAETDWKGPQEFILDLGGETHLSRIMFWDLYGHADVFVYAGEPDAWTEIAKEDGVGNKVWKTHGDLDVRTRYLRVVAPSNSGGFGEMLVYAYTPEGSVIVAENNAAAKRREAMIIEAKVAMGKRLEVETGTLFGKLPLVDEILTGSTPPGSFEQDPKDISKVENLLGKPARVLPNEGDEPKFFAYKVGEGKYIEPGKAYLLTVEFPDDKPRTFYVSNRGADMTRGIQTGAAVGDTLFSYTNSNLESLNIPQSQQYEIFQQLFWLNDRFDGIEQNRDPKKRHFSPIDGFYVIIGQAGAKQIPLGDGAAVSRIRLFEVRDPSQYNVPLNLPQGLPHRALFYREEMADAVINSLSEEERTVTNPTDWYIYHMRLMNFLGMNTFSKDLLEFGHPQHWDVENPSWYRVHKFPHVWSEIVDAATEHNLTLLPYYEYAGSTGQQGRGRLGALEERVIPLSDEHYTHVRWAEANKVDLTDPETLEEFKRVLYLTIIRYKDKGHFLGAWLRTRISQMPMSFAIPTLKRFAEDTGREPMERKELEDDPEALEDYYEWWFNQRKEFLLAIHDYLKENGIGEDNNPLVFFMPIHQEPVPKFLIRGVQKSLVTDQPELWQEELKERSEYENMLVLSEDEVRDNRMYYEAITSPLKTWSTWEWHHAAPQADPQHYQDLDGVMITYPFNRKYTVSDPQALEAYRTKSGLAMVRQFPLNEDTMDNITGYFVTDFERIGSYQMLPEVLAVANGDPWYIGYTSGHVFNRGFPDSARRFNANFLALPAMPSEVLPGAASEEDVVVRVIKTPRNGTYVAVINTGLKPLKDVNIALPKAGEVSAAVSGQRLSLNTSTIKLDLEPVELKTLLVR